jgi:hypothetical protein
MPWLSVVGFGIGGTFPGVIAMSALPLKADLQPAEKLKKKANYRT